MLPLKRKFLPQCQMLWKPTHRTFPLPKPTNPSKILCFVANSGCDTLDTFMNQVANDWNVRITPKPATQKSNCPHKNAHGNGNSGSEQTPQLTLRMSKLLHHQNVNSGEDIVKAAKPLPLPEQCSSNLATQENTDEQD